MPATWANLVNALLGAWFFLAPLAMASTGSTGEVSIIIGGAIVLVFAGWAALREEARRSAWIQ